MNQLDKIFQSEKRNLLNVYCTAGYPHLHSMPEIILSLQKNGADMIEIGMPYSDPIADGPVIQESNMQALENGMNMHLLFQQLEDVKEKLTVPVILMGYLNPVLQFGIEKFCEAAQRVGVSAVIIPDIPLYEYENSYKHIFIKYGIHFIFLVSPGTTKKRLKQADNLSQGFIYAVSSSATTGKDVVFQEDYFNSLQKARLRNPLMIGFGIKDKQTFDAACRYGRGAIIGSAYIQALRDTSDIDLTTKEFIACIIH